MKKFTTIASMMIFGALCANAGNLWILGDATPYGWSTDDATCMVSKPATPELYQGTLYLKAGSDFKFLATKDFGGPEYGAVVGTQLTNGKVALAGGTNDEGYGKLQVNQDGNYAITVDLIAMEATVTLAAYQEKEIKLCSMFMIGDATEGSWSVDDGTPLYQNQTAPYMYETETTLKEGNFKIATVIKGGGSFDSKYYYFRDANDAGKIALNQEGDLQWNISAEGVYDIAVNTNANTISIKEHDITGVSVLNTDNTPAEYYNLQGVKLAEPAAGLYICKQGNKVMKVIVK